MVANDYGKRVFSIAFYESIVVFNIDSRRCFICSPTSNGGVRLYPEDGSGGSDRGGAPARFIKHLPLARVIVQMARGVYRPLIAKFQSRTQKVYFD
jgi:hypothetical protein